MPRVSYFSYLFLMIEGVNPIGVTFDVHIIRQKPPQPGLMPAILGDPFFISATLAPEEAEKLAAALIARGFGRAAPEAAAAEDSLLATDTAGLPKDPD